jgi:choline dehydrogenase-like flavoprotein
MSIITQPLNGRPACHYCGHCNRGCTVGANFSSPDVLIAPALRTGRLTLITNAMAREVTLGADGLANGVSFINKNNSTDEHVRARIVVLAASACETARLLLNSKSTRFPQGLANSSGKVGKYLTDSTGVSVSGHIPAMMDHVPHNEDGIGGQHIYMPWWLDNRQLGFPRGYHIEVYGGLGAPGSGFMGGIQRYAPGGGYGAALKNDYRRYYGSTIGFSGRGEMIPNDDSYCEIDPDAKDKFGIPVLRFHWRWSDHEIDQAGHMHQTFRALLSEMGATVSPMPTRERRYGISTGGSIIHELGCAIMGSDPSASVVNSNCQAHDVRNLFVTDGSPFVSQPDKNPTWTILALAWRTSEYIAQQRRGGAL